MAGLLAPGTAVRASTAVTIDTPSFERSGVEPAEVTGNWVPSGASVCNSLTGTFKASTSVLPDGYMLDDAYGGANTIALVNVGGTVILVR